MTYVIGDVVGRLVFRNNENAIWTTKEIGILFGWPFAFRTTHARQYLHEIRFFIEEKDLDRQLSRRQFSEKLCKRGNASLEIRNQAPSLCFVGVGEKHEMLGRHFKPLYVLCRQKRSVRQDAQQGI